MTQPETKEHADISAAESEHEFFANSGPLPSSWDDGRQFPRFHFRACVDALVYPPAGDPSQEPQHCQVLTRDISRGGMNILHKAQLFPGQFADVVLHDGQQRRLEIMWCRRLGAGCFTAGCRFVRADGSVVGEGDNAEGADTEGERGA
jgi:hypothetical protein